jgi:hypothetical protein
MRNVNMFKMREEEKMLCIYGEVAAAGENKFQF